MKSGNLPSNQKLYSEKDVLRLLGWLSADISELKHFAVPELIDAWQRFKRDVLADETTATPGVSAVLALANATCQFCGLNLNNPSPQCPVRECHRTAKETS